MDCSQRFSIELPPIYVIITLTIILFARSREVDMTLDPCTLLALIPLAYALVFFALVKSVLRRSFYLYATVFVL